MLKPSLQKRLRARSPMVSDAFMNGEDEDDDGSDIFEYLFNNPTHRRHLRRDGGMLSRRRGGVDSEENNGGDRDAGSDCGGEAVSLEGGKRGRHGSGGDDESARKRQRLGSSSKEGTTGEGRPETFDLVENPACKRAEPSLALNLVQSVEGMPADSLAGDPFRLRTVAESLIQPSTASDAIWMSSCATAQGLPPIPVGVSRQEFVRLVYSKTCRFCNARNIQKIHWAARVRACKACLEDRNHFVDEAKALDDLDGVQGAWTGSLLQLLPPIVTGKSQKARMSPKYMTLSIDELIDDYEDDKVKRMGGEGQKAWYARKLQAMEDIHEHVKVCERWYEERDEDKAVEADAIRKQRRTDIAHRLTTEMGWGQELQQPGVLDELYKYPWVSMAKPLTDNAWKNMKGRVVKFLQELRAKRLGLTGAAREMDDLKTTKLWRYAANQRYGTT
ncbi:hypothetical protein K523DRAFT_342757 [Schizophyllum commune Tattone D]|nr:hypothetical protein K523DRAFT_342757 [Schizophyllum commune Tattone D]